MLKVKKFVFSLFGVNTYLAIDESTKKTAIIDPAMQKPVEEGEISRYVSDNNLEITNIINTHLHLDHCFGANWVKRTYGVKLMAAPADAILGKIIPQQYQMFGIKPVNEIVEIDVNLIDGETISIGDSVLKVFATPGHTQGGIVLYDEKDKLLFSGDTIFYGSVGRTDLPGGNHTQLINSIRTKIFTLPDDVKILPGHGEASSVGYERTHNPYV